MIRMNGFECIIEKEGKGKDVSYNVVAFEENENKIITNINIPGVASESENIIAIKDKGMLKMLERKGIVRSLLGFKRIKNKQVDITVPIIMIDQNKLLHL